MNRLALLVLGCLVAAVVFAGEWRYSSSPVAESPGQVARRAELASENAIPQPGSVYDPPKQIRASLAIFDSDAGTRMTFYLLGTDIYCDINADSLREECQIEVQLDDDESVRVPMCRGRLGGMLRFDEPVEFIRTMQRGRRLRVMLTLWGFRTPTRAAARLGVMTSRTKETAEFTFDVAGLEFEAKGSEPACSDRN